MGMEPRQRLFTVVGEGLVKLNVLFVTDLALRQTPQSRRIVDLLKFGHRLGLFLIPFAGGLFGLVFEENGIGDVVGVFFDDLFDPPGVVELFGILFELDVDDGAVLILGDRFDLKLTCTVRAEHIRLLFARFFCDDIDVVCDHEDGVKSDPELPDEVAVFFGIAGELIDESPGARLGNRTEVVHEILLVHSDTVVNDGEGVVILVKADDDLGIPIHLFETLIGQPEVVKFIKRVIGIGDELPDEDLFVGVEGVGQQMEQLPDFGLILMFGHCRLLVILKFSRL